jgi:hypothetical protein
MHVAAVEPFKEIDHETTYISQDLREKNGKTGMLGQDRLEVRWEAVMFLFNVVNLNV